MAVLGKLMGNGFKHGQQSRMGTNIQTSGSCLGVHRGKVLQQGSIAKAGTRYHLKPLLLGKGLGELR
jgi:hypothetical protein